jgi:hypothetical protein
MHGIMNSIMQPTGAGVKPSLDWKPTWPPADEGSRPQPGPKLHTYLAAGRKFNGYRILLNWLAPLKWKVSITIRD